jgi:crossover junction endodeoxyribonuclease RusA
MADRALELVLPWPHKDLSPNGRVHWRDKAKAVKKARQTAVVLAFEAGWKGAQLPPGRLHLWVTFYQAPGKPIPDDDNMLGRFKAYRDGIAQVLGIDDKRFVSHPFVHTERRKGGQVVVRITGGPQEQHKGNDNG